MGADPRIHHARRRIRVRLPVRAGVLPAAVAVDQRVGRGVSVDRPVDRWRRCSRLCSVCWRSRSGGCPAGRSGSPGCGRPQEWLKSTVPFGGFPWGVVGFQPNRRPAAVDRADRRRAAAVVRGRADRIQPGRNRFRDRAVVASRRPDPEIAAPPAVVVPGVCISRRAVGDRAGVAARPAVRSRAPATTRRSPWPPCRATCRGSGWSSTPSAAPCSTITSAKPSGWPRTCAPAGRRSRWSSSGRRTPRISIRWPIRTPAAEISTAAAAINAPILVGGVVAAPGYSRDNPVSTNSVIVWNPETGPADRHDKQIVQPFGEYLPWRSFFRLLSSYADRAGYFVPGNGNGVVHAAGVPVGVTTCWEVIFDRAARESVRNGAQLLAVPTNNATFDEAMSEQQLAFARLRAVEHDRYVVVAGTTGISAVIAPDGRELARTAFFEPAYLDTQVRLKTQLTPATRWGPLVEGVLVAHRRWGCDRRDTAQWEFRASATTGARNDQRSHMTTGPGGERPSQRTLVIIPTYNERENLPLIVGRVHDARPDVHILIVDDGSPDGTGELADELALADPDRVHVMHRDGQGRPGRGVPGGVRVGPGSRVLGPGRDGRRRQPPARTAAPPARRHRRRRGSGDRLALRQGRRGAQLAAAADGAVAHRQRLFAHPARRRHPRHHRRIPRLPARGAGEDRPGRRRLEGLLLPDRPDLAHHQQRVRRRRGADHVHRARVRPIQDERIQHPRSPVQGRGVGCPRAPRSRPRRRAR